MSLDTARMLSGETERQRDGFIGREPLHYWSGVREEATEAGPGTPRPPSRTLGAAKCRKIISHQREMGKKKIGCECHQMSSILLGVSCEHSRVFECHHWCSSFLDSIQKHFFSMSLSLIMFKIVYNVTNVHQNVEHHKDCNNAYMSNWTPSLATYLHVNISWWCADGLWLCLDLQNLWNLLIFLFIVASEKDNVSEVKER